MLEPAKRCPEGLERATAIIADRYGVAPSAARTYAVAALDGIDAHGLDPCDWRTGAETIDVVVGSWIRQAGK